MKPSRILAGLAVAALALNTVACAGIHNATPEQTIGLVKAFSDAGCKGTVHAAVGGATGQLGGGFHAEASVDGSCDPADKPPAAGVVTAGALVGAAGAAVATDTPPTR